MPETEAGCLPMHQEVKMLTLRVVAEIDPNKRQEFLQAMKTFQELSEGDRYHLYSELDSENSYCLELDREKKAQLEEYLESCQFQFFSGAVTVLGAIVDAEIITASEVTPIPDLVSGSRS
jgi:hypothetical protein